MSLSFTINGKAHETHEDPNMPLLWFVRDIAGYKGTKFGCGLGLCGSCTLHVDGQAVRSCVLPISAVAAKSVTTIEGLPDGESGSVQRTWLELQVPQCGYCQSGMIMAAAALLSDNPDPSDEDIDAEITNICRCGTYPRVKQAIKQAAELKRNGDATSLTSAQTSTVIE
ncbi:MAG: (2Fe-2S)-binding protein [Pseudomonadota bacterium]